MTNDAKYKLFICTKKTLVSFLGVLPVIFGMLLLTSLVTGIFSHQMLTGVFGNNDLLDTVIGATVGGVAAGHPMASYIFGGELLSAGVGLFAVTALIVSWVTVGVVQLPAEALLLGKHFAIYRNLLCYLISIAVALLTVYTIQLTG